MLRKIAVSVVFLGLLSLSFGQQALASQDFRFANWPLVDFEKRTFLNSFGSSHFGADIGADYGEDVLAAADGNVYWTYSGGAHGIAVGVEHHNGYRTTYLHLSERLVKKGQEVKAGHILGKVGTSGTGRDAEEPHLHFGLIINSQADISQPASRYADPLLFGPLQLAAGPNEVAEASEAEIQEVQLPLTEAGLQITGLVSQPAAKKLPVTLAEPQLQWQAVKEIQPQGAGQLSGVQPRGLLEKKQLGQLLKARLVISNVSGIEVEKGLEMFNEGGFIPVKSSAMVVKEPKRGFSVYKISGAFLLGLFVFYLLTLSKNSIIKFLTKADFLLRMLTWAARFDLRGKIRRRSYGFVRADVGDADIA